MINKNDENKTKWAMFLQQYENKSLEKDTGQKLEITFDVAFASHNKDALRKVAGEVFSYLEEYPELKQELKEIYFK